MRIYKLALLLIITCTPRAFAQNAANYKIYSTQAGKEITLSQLLTESARASVLFFGEEHNDSIAHSVEYAIWQSRAGYAGNNSALSLEMFQTDSQVILDEYLAGIISEKNFLADARPWPNYNDYRPMVEYAREHRNPVIAANAPSRYTNLVSRKGLSALALLSGAARRYIAPLPVDTLTGLYLQNFKELMGGHTSMGGLRLYQAQNLWDATMASSIAGALASNTHLRVMHICGRFHSDYKQGTIAFLQRYMPTVKPVNISCFKAADFANPAWVKYAKFADYIIITR